MECDLSAPVRVNVVASGVGHCMNTNVAEIGLSDEGTDIVIGEAMLSMQGEKAKQAVMSETARILRPGGHCVIHELGMRPDSATEGPATEIHCVLARTISVNTQSPTITDWGRAPEKVDLVVERTRMAPVTFLKPSHVIVDEGMLRALRIVHSVARDKNLRKRVTTMVRTFEKYDRHLCGIAAVTRRPKKNQ